MPCFIHLTACANFKAERRGKCNLGEIWLSILEEKHLVAGSIIHIVYVT